MTKLIVTMRRVTVRRFEVIAETAEEAHSIVSDYGYMEACNDFHEAAGGGTDTVEITRVSKAPS